MFCDLCFNFKNMSLTLFAEVGCLGQSKELKDSEVNDININKTQYFRLRLFDEKELSAERLLAGIRHCAHSLK